MSHECALCKRRFAGVAWREVPGGVVCRACDGVPCVRCGAVSKPGRARPLRGRDVICAACDPDARVPQDLPIDRRPREQAAVARAGGPPRVGGSSRLERKLEAEASQEVLDVLSLLRHQAKALALLVHSQSAELGRLERRIAALEKRPRAGKRSKPRATR
jgi:hypothetical protein